MNIAILNGGIVQVVILAGGLGTRLSEETDKIPKPMVLIGDKPMLRHIIDYYRSFGHKKFIIAAGYKAEKIDEYFQNEIFKDETQVQVVDTGLQSNTGGRILALESHLDPTFLLTYGDGLSNVDINATLKLFESNDALAQVTAVRPPARFGTLDIRQDGFVAHFREKSPAEAGWINGGFFVFSKSICKLLSSSGDSLEGDLLTQLAENGQLTAYEHHGWWQPMDTLRERNILSELWASGEAPWLNTQQKQQVHQ